MRVEWTEEALRKLLEIESYIAQDAPETAIRFVAKLVERAKKVIKGNRLLFCKQRINHCTFNSSVTFANYLI